MTPSQQFDQALRQRLRERATTVLATTQKAVAELQAIRATVLEQLAAQPADWQRWQLTQLLAQIQAVLDGAAGQVAATADAGLRQAWQQGEDLVDKPLAAAGVNVELRLPLLDVQVLTRLRAFVNLRLKDVAAEAARKIGGQLSLVTVGAQTPFAAIRAIQKLLGNDTPQRATTIVRTEMGSAFSIASHQRMEQAVALVPGLQKQWRRSGKIHSRWNHDAIDGQVVPVDQPFVLPTHHGPLKIMHPHDPKAPPEEKINCGCLALPYVKDWQVLVPGARPFTQRELKLDGRKAALDQAAKRAGLRQS